MELWVVMALIDSLIIIMGFDYPGFWETKKSNAEIKGGTCMPPLNRIPGYHVR